jgi:hypothetical protein
MFNHNERTYTEIPYKDLDKKPDKKHTFTIEPFITQWKKEPL